MVGRGEAVGFLEGLPRILPKPLEETYDGIAGKLGLPGSTQVFLLEIIIIEAVEEEVGQVRNDGLGSFGFEKFHQVIVGGRQELHENFADDADPGLSLIRDGQGVEIMYDVPAHLPVFGVGENLVIRNEVNDPLLPFLMELVGRARHFLIRADPEEAAHEDVTELQGVEAVLNELGRDGKARVLLEADRVQGDDRYPVPVAGLGQGPPNEAHVVRGPTAAARLGDEEGRVVHVILARVNGRHELADHHHGRIAGIVVYVLEAVVDAGLSRNLRHDEIVACRLEGRGDDLEVNRGHLRSQNRIGLLHLLGERSADIVRGVQGPLLLLPVADAEGSQKRPDTDPGGSQIVYFVYLQAGIDFPGPGQDVGDAVGCDGVHPAAEGVQLDDIEVVPVGRILGGRIHAGVVHPLVEDDEGPLQFP